MKTSNIKHIIAPILASAVSGGIGYWAVGACQQPSIERVATEHRISHSIFPAPTRVPEAESWARLASSAQAAATTQSSVAVASDDAMSGEELSAPIPESAEASVDDNIRFTPTTRPTTPVPQNPPPSNETNVDTGKPIHEWQRLTDDWFGIRPKLDDRGIAIEASLTTDYSKVLSGGVDTAGSAFRHLFNLNITLNTEKLINFKGGTLFVDFQNQAGDNGAEDVGDLQGISNIDADGRTQISELWYEQILLDGKLRTKIGKVDANGEFAHTPTADEFVNGAFGAAPTILGFPTYPDPATSFNLFVVPNDNCFASFGVYDGSTVTGHPTGDFGPASAFDANHLFYIGEAGLKWSGSRGRDGTFTLGAWHHTADFDRFDGGVDSGTTGEYAMLDQMLWRENPDNKDDSQGISLFAKYSYADPNVSAISHQIAIGATWTGVVPTRDDDVLGAGLSWARLSDQGGFDHNSETVYEAFYRVRVNAWLSVKPDIQYIHNAADGGARDSVVGLVRLVVDF